MKCHLFVVLAAIADDKRVVDDVVVRQCCTFRVARCALFNENFCLLAGNSVERNTDVNWMLAGSSN
jgi:hypothetical protein